MQQKILFVCLGNICRSPLAEAIFNKQIQTRGLSEKYSADSCGTSDFHIGERPDARTIRNARHHEIELEHLGRQLVVQDFSQFDLILTMDRANHQHTLDLSAKAQHKSAEIRMVRSFDPESFGAHDVPDPWYGNEEGFEEVFQILWRSCDALINHLELQTPKKLKSHPSSL